MEVVVRLSTEEASLIQQLIGLAEDNDFFESEFDDEHVRGSYKKLHELACRLRQKLASVDESDGKEAADGEPANLGGTDHVGKRQTLVGRFRGEARVETVSAARAR